MSAVPPLNRPEWADEHPDDAWQEDPETGGLVTVHEHAVGNVGGARVALVREDTYRDGKVLEGPVLVHVSQTPDVGLSPQGAAELGHLLMLTSVRAADLWREALARA